MPRATAGCHDKASNDRVSIRSFHHSSYPAARIATERAELDHLLARRRISERVAEGVRAGLDVDETTMGP